MTKKAHSESHIHDIHSESNNRNNKHDTLQYMDQDQQNLKKNHVVVSFWVVVCCCLLLIVPVSVLSGIWKLYET